MFPDVDDDVSGVFPCEDPALAESRLHATLQSARWLNCMGRLDAEVPDWRKYSPAGVPNVRQFFIGVWYFDFLNWRWRDFGRVWHELPDWPVLVDVPPLLCDHPLRRVLYPIRCGTRLMDNGYYLDACAVDKDGRLRRNETTGQPIVQHSHTRTRVKFYPPELLKRARPGSILSRPLKVVYYDYPHPQPAPHFNYS